MIQIVKTTDSELLSDLNEDIQTLHNRLYPTLFKPYQQQEIAHDVKQILREPNVNAFAVYQDDVPVGYVLTTLKTKIENAFMYGHRLLLVTQLSVSIPNRGKGFGKVLLEKVYSEAAAAGIDRIELDHWTLNEPARIFFEKNGFRYFNEKMVKKI